MTSEGYVINAFGKVDPQSPFQQMQILRGQSDENDVEIDIHYCGIGDWDVQFCRDDLGNTNFPIVPGREMAGVVRWVGRNVQDFKRGDRVGVGTVVDSCMRCEQCKANREHACKMGFTMAFNEPTRHGHIATDSGYTYGGFSERITVHQNFVIKVPYRYPLKSAAACLTVGASIYTPLKKYGGLTERKRVAFLGMGNEAMLGIRLCALLGHEVTALTVHENKESLAFELGADHFLSWAKAEDMRKAYRKYDLIFNTLSGPHEVSSFLPMLDYGSTIICMGLMGRPHSVIQYPDLIRRCLSVAGSNSGSVVDSSETMELFASHGVRPIQTIVLADQLDDVFEVLSNPATTIARYTLDVRRSFQRLRENEQGAIRLASSVSVTSDDEL